MKWLALLFAFVASAALAAGRVFSDGFENGLASGWQQDAPFDECTVVTTAVDGGAPLSGTHQAQCNWDGTAQWNTPSYVHSHASLKLPTSAYPYTREFFVRFWARYATDVQNVRGNCFFDIMPNNGGWHPNYLCLAGLLDQAPGPLFVEWDTEGNSGDGSKAGGFGPVFWGSWYYYDGDIWVNGQFAGVDDGCTHSPLCPTSYPVVPGDHQWHKYEVYLKANTPGNADGTARLWVDGKRLISVDNDTTVDPVNVPTTIWGPLRLVGFNNSMTTANNHTYFDNFEVYTDQGTGAAGSMSDATIFMPGSCP